MKKSFTLLELLIVVIIVGILAFSINFNFFNPSLEAAADQVIKDIRYTQSLALKDDKYQPFPKHTCDNSDEGKIECNRSKYWFKQWWQIRFSQNTNDKNWWYEIFSDQPTANKKIFDKKGYSPKYLRDISLAKNPLTGKYMIGNCDKNGFPDCNSSSPRLNLTKTYNIKKIIFINIPHKRLLFDNLGNVFLNEGDSEDSGDINPIDKDKRIILTTIGKIQLCLDNNCIKNKDRCIQINITPIGEVYKSLCN